MAYQYTDYSGYGNETDEETRKRRAQMASMFAGGMPIGDMASQYLGNRVNEATQNVQNVANVVTNPEEEMRKRMGMIQQQPKVQVAGPAMMPQQPTTADPAEQERIRLERLRQAQQRQQGMTTASVTPGQLPTTAQPQPIVEQQPQWAKDLIGSQGNQTKLHAFIGNETYPEEQRKWAAGLLQKMYKDEADRDDANALIQRYATGDTSAINTVTKELKKKSEDGSYLKAILYSRLGLNDLAQQEQQKLGAGTKVGQASIDGKQYTVEYGANGSPLRAWNVRGTEVGEDTLAKISAGGLRPGAQIFGFTGEVGIVKDPTSGQEVEVRQRTNSQTGQIENVIVTGPNAGKIYSGSAIPQSKSVSTAMAKMDYQTITALQQRHGGNVLDALKEFQSIKGPLNDAERQQFLQLYGYGTTVPGGAMPGQPQTGARPTPQGQPAMAQPRPQQAAPVSAPVVPGQMPRPTGGLTTPIGTLQTQQQLGRKAGEAAIETQAQGERTILTEAAKQVAASPDTQNMLAGIDKVTQLLDSGQHNVGSLASGVVGRGRVAQAIGSQFETVDAKNTKTIMDTVNKLAADGLKTLGTNPSTVDLEFWTKFKPDASSDPEFVKEWIESRSADLKRRLGYAGTQQRAGGRAGPAPEIKQQPKLSREDTQALEWARKNPNDPRAKEIKQRLGL
jgi:hypothetical protein